MSKRHDLQEGTGRIEYLPGRGTVQAYGPGMGTSGTPTNGTTGFAPGCIWQDLIGSGFYLNIGSFTSSLWIQLTASSSAPVLRVTGNATFDAATYNGKTIVLDTTGNTTFLLPPANGSGYSGIIFLNTTLVGSNTTNIRTTAGDVFAGPAFMVTDNANASAVGFNGTQTGNITLNSTGTGGIKGGQIEYKDVAPATWMITVKLIGAGTEATPFAA